LFTRFLGPGTGPLQEVPGQILGNSLLQAPLNFASRLRRGIDIEAAYRGNLGGVRLDTRVLYTHNLKNSNFQDPTRPKFEDRLLGELGQPEDEARFDVALTRGPFTIGYQMSYIGKMYVNAYEDFNTLQGRPPQDADYASIEQTPDVFYHDVRLEWNVQNRSGGIGRDLNFYVGVDNLTNREPPLGFQGNGERSGSAALLQGTSIFRTRNRSYFAGARVRF
jgi:hypothetical protein